MIHGARLMLIAVLLAASAHNLRMLTTGTARFHPVLLGVSTDSRVAARLVGLAFLANVLAATLLTFRPEVGGVASLLLLFVYTGVGWRALPAALSGGRGCACFGTALLDARSRYGILARNGFLGLAAALVMRGPYREPVDWAVAIPWAGTWTAGLVAVASVPEMVGVRQKRIARHYE